MITFRVCHPCGCILAVAILPALHPAAESGEVEVYVRRRRDCGAA